MQSKDNEIVIKNLELLEVTPGTIDKKKILIDIFKTNAEPFRLLERIFIWSVSKHQRIGVKFKVLNEMPHNSGSFITHSIEKLMDTIDKYASSEFGDIKGEAKERKAALEGSINWIYCSYTYLKWIERIVDKNLRCGIAVTLLNDAMREARGVDFIETSPCMLIKDINEKRLDAIFKDNEFAIVQPKYDGVRCLAYVNKANESVTLKSRAGLEIKGFPALKKHIWEFCKYLNTNFNVPEFVLDGELLGRNNAISHQQIMNQLKRIDQDESEIHYVVFDIFRDDVEDYKVPLEDRDAILTPCAFKSNPMVSKAETSRIMRKGIESYFNACVEHGYEGIVIKAKNSLYQKGKIAKDCARRKVSETFDLKCVGMEEGKGRLKGTMGALFFEYCGKEVKAGTGFSDKQRAEIYSKFESEYLGRIAELECQQTSKNTLRNPVFLHWRENTKEVSYA